jgi:hypothetical protein
MLGANLENVHGLILTDAHTVQLGSSLETRTCFTIIIPDAYYHKIVHMMRLVQRSRAMMVAALAKLCHCQQVFQEFVYEGDDIRLRLQISKTCNVSPECFAGGVEQPFSIYLFAQTLTNGEHIFRLIPERFSAYQRDPPVDVDDLSPLRGNMDDQALCNPYGTVVYATASIAGRAEGRR